MDPSDILLTGRVAIVTGSGTGIGKGIAVGMAKFGADVVIAEIDEALGRETAAEIQATGRKGLFVKTDVRKPDEVKAMFARAVSELGRVDILVNNVGFTPRKLFKELSEPDWQEAVNLNLMSVFRCTSAAIEQMVKQNNGGCIINITSIEAFRGCPTHAVYSACKAGLTNFTKTMALELAPHKIRVNAIAPDITDTPWIRRGMSPVFEKNLENYVPLGRIGTTDEVAWAAIFLASNASSYVTGDTMQVNGGTYAASGWFKHAKSRRKWMLVPFLQHVVDDYE